MSEEMKCPRCGGPTRWVYDDSGKPAHCDTCTAFINKCLEADEGFFKAEADIYDPDSAEEE